MRLVACALRQPGWAPIRDTAHAPAGVARTTVDTTTITVWLDVPALAVGAVTVTPDETLCGTIAAGASVGLDRVVIKLRDMHGNQLDPTQVDTAGKGNLWVLGAMH